MGQAALADAPDHVMWGQVVADDGFRIMAFDVQAGRPYDAGKKRVLHLAARFDA